MKGYFIFVSLLFAMIIILSTFSCTPTGTSEVTIRINLGLNNQNAFNIHEDSIIDRIFRFFTKDAEAQAAPEGITAIGLNITGEGMSAINESYSAGTSVITINVPAGPARVCLVTAYRPTGNYGGSSEPYDLEAGQSVEIPITMAEQYANVTINPTFPNGNPASIILPYSVNVTTGTNTVLSSTFTPGTPISVPAGDAKNFEVLISTPSVTFRDSVSVNLTADTPVTIAPSMTLYETKIVIPDPQISRIVQIDDMIGTGWSVRSTISGISSFSPYDIDFDSQGRIYIANNNAATGNDVIISIDSFTGSDTLLFGTNGSGYAAIAIDRINNFVYCARSGVNTLWKYDLDGNLISEITFSPTILFLSIRGLAVDDNGNLYIAAQSDLVGQEVIKCTPSNPSTNVVRYSTDLLYPWDVIVKNGYLYIADFDNTFTYDSSKVVQLSLDLGYIDQLGTAESSTFYGLHRFLAILNNRFYLIDEDENTVPNETERIVAFDNLSSSIDAFDPSMVGQSAFQFYSGS